MGKKFYNSLKIGPNFFLQHFKNKIVQFCEIYGSKKRYDNKFFFHPCLSLLFLDPRSGIWDKHPGSATLVQIIPQFYSVFSMSSFKAYFSFVHRWSSTTPALSLLGPTPGAARRRERGPWECLPRAGLAAPHPSPHPPSTQRIHPLYSSPALHR
jgi:hypothetical protein